MRVTAPLLSIAFASLSLAPLACTTETDPGDLLSAGTESGDGDGDPTTDPSTGDGDGDATTDPSTGDGDGDATTDPSTGDGDGDATTDPSTGDGDGDETGGAECGADPGWGQVAIGEPVKHVQAKNQEGEAVNLCEWAGMPIALDAAAVWCGPCQLASEYLSTGQGQDPFSGLGPGLKTAVDNGNIIWITTLMDSAQQGVPGTVSDAEAWDANYPHPNIPVLVEDDVPMLSGYLPGNCVPRVFVIDPEMNFWALDDCASWNHLGDMLDEWG